MNICSHFREFEPCDIFPSLLLLDFLHFLVLFHISHDLIVLALNVLEVLFPCVVVMLVFALEVPSEEPLDDGGLSTEELVLHV